MINLTDEDLLKNPSLRQQMLFELENLDPRRIKKYHDSLVKSYQDFEDYTNLCKLEYKYQSIIRNQYLSNSHPIRVYDLKLLLRQNHLLNNSQINRIIEHLENNNKHVIVEDHNRQNPLTWELYKYPRHSILTPKVK